MDFKDFVKKVEENLGFATIVLALISLYYYTFNKKPFLDYFIYLVLGLFTFTSVFYTVIVVSQFTTRLLQLNVREERRLVGKIRELSNEENRNINTKNYKRNSEVCSEKSTIYDELDRVRVRSINRYLLTSVFLLLLIMIININFLSEIEQIKNYVPVLSIILFWISIFYIVKIVITFYNVYST